MATTPKIRAELATVDPKTFPNAMESFPLKTDLMPNVISGKVVPIATKINPTINKEKFKVIAIFVTDQIIIALLPKITINPAINFPIFPKKSFKYLTSRETELYIL